MNENLDLTKILEGCPKGTKFYSTIFGEVSFVGIHNYYNKYPIKLQAYNKSAHSTVEVYYAEDGRSSCIFNGECTLFPSKDQRDWSKFVRFWDKLRVDKFDPNAFEPFQKVLVRDYTDAPWTIDFFSYRSDKIKNIRGVKYCWIYCIPYNVDTKHLVGKVQDCPEYYKWWEK